jgi:SsrA-binding protein
MQQKAAMARQVTHQTEPNKPKNVKRDPVASGERDASVNRAASHNYFLEDRMETGIMLSGSEVKSVRAGRANLKDAYALVKDGELWLLNAHIGAYENAGYAGHAEKRTRKLLVHKEELRRLLGKSISKMAKSKLRSRWPKANRPGTSAKPNAAVLLIKKPAKP